MPSDKNQLFFSSDGHYGLGGLDVFVTELNKDYTHKELINLGASLNSSTDDFSLIMDTKDNTGFFASNRNNGTGSDDIYSFVVHNDLITACKQHLTGNVTDEITNLPLSKVNVKALDTNFQEIETTTTDENGVYTLDLDCNQQFLIRISGEEILTKEELITTGSGFETTLEKDFVTKEGGNLSKTKIKYGDDLSKILQLEPIYFDFDKSMIRSSSEVELQKIISFLKKNKKPNLDIRSHTDSQGKRDYNLELSEQRAQQTINYLIKNGISANRITGKGYGDTQLINKCSHGVICSESQHQLNRRSEFILFYNNDSSITKNTIPNTLNKGNQNTEAKISDVKAENTTNNKPKTKVVSEFATNNEVISSKEYNFSSNKQIYTIQLAAHKNSMSTEFDSIENVFKHIYADGLTRYFTGVFSTYIEAQQYKKELIKRGVNYGFITILKGEQILKIK